MAKIIGDLPDISIMTIPSLEDLQAFGAVHPGIGALLQAYTEGAYDLEDMLMLVIAVLIAEFYQIRAQEQRRTGKCSPPLVNCIPPNLL
ncbi:MAG: hypothetical protein WC359_13260 [Dehalococcoidia bacterium]|jgi:hypothetical protein